MQATARMPVRVDVTDGSQVSEARRAATGFARRQGLSEHKLGKVALVVTELATNLVKHTPHGGEILLQSISDGAGTGLEVVALDSGPGIHSASVAIGDGFSTSGSAGTGLGAIKRQSDFFDLYSQPELGTALLVRFWEGAAANGGRINHLEIGAVRAPRPGEAVCGDDWFFAEYEGRALLLVVDGLGHGAAALEAAEQAVKTFRYNSSLQPAEQMKTIHAALRHTRGGVAAVAEVSANREKLTFVGVGNISGNLWSGGSRRSMVSQPGTLGQELRRVQPFHYPWKSDSLLILHSDGVTTRQDLNNHPGLAGRCATLIAAVLYRDYRRGRDDSVVTVVREASG